MKLHDIMTLSPKTVAPEETLRAAAKLMQKSNIGFLPVVEGGRLVGVLTDRDMVIRGLSKSPQPGCVKDIMTQKPVTIAPSAEISSAIKLMREYKVGRLPVVDDKKGLRGVVSFNDIARASGDSRSVSELAIELGESHRPSSQAATLAEV